MDYGVNMNGMPTPPAGVGSGSGGSQPTCPTGYVWSAEQQSCTPKTSPGQGSGDTFTPPGQRSPNTGVNGGQTFSPAGVASGNATTPPTTSTPAPPAFDINSWGQNWLRSGGKTLADFQNYVKSNPLGAGYSLSGSKGDKVVGPDGRSGYDMVIASGLGGTGASFSPFGGNASPGASPTAYLTSGASGQFPWTAPPPQSYQPGTYTDDPSKKTMADLIEKMLTTTSMSPEAVAQMKEGQKDSILNMMDQIKQSTLGSAASRGTLGGGSLASMMQDIGTKGVGDISSAYRDLDVKKVMQDRLDQENAVSAAGNFNNNLFQEYLGKEGLNRGASQDAFYNWLSQQGINLDWLKFLQNNQLDVAKFLAG